MNKNKGIIITIGILGAFMLFFALIAIGLAFGVDFLVSFEYNINTSWGWTNFNLLVWSLVIMALFVIAIISVLVISDDKHAKQTKRVRKNSFQ